MIWAIGRAWPHSPSWADAPPDDKLCYLVGDGKKAYLVEVDLEYDTTTVSGFRWTSRAGADLSFGSGTLVSGKIIIEQTRPVALIMPALRRWLRG